MRIHRGVWAGVALAAAGLSMAFGADRPAPKKGIGPISFHSGKTSATGVGKPTFEAVLSEGFTIDVPSQYDVSGSTAHIWGTPSAIRRITAEGAGEKQVQVIFNNTAESTRIRFLADHAEMEPEQTAAQPKGQKVTFTGHVTMFVSNPVALEEESKSTMTRAIVHLGDGPEYPMVEADDVNGTAIPAKGH